MLKTTMLVSTFESLPQQAEELKLKKLVLNCVKEKPIRWSNDDDAFKNLLTNCL